jgi:primosomal protein N''
MKQRWDLIIFLKGEKPQNKNRKTRNLFVKNRTLYVKYIDEISKTMQACK